MLLAISAVPELSGRHSLLRLLVAAGLGAAVGVEREVREREANRLVVELRKGAALQPLLDVPGLTEVDVEDERDRRVVTLALDRFPDEPLISLLSDSDDVLAVRWRR